jgi:hypothetical protein
MQHWRFERFRDGSLENGTIPPFSQTGTAPAIPSASADEPPNETMGK